jgi:hypothetical protein
MGGRGKLRGKRGRRTKTKAKKKHSKYEKEERLKYQERWERETFLDTSVNEYFRHVMSDLEPPLWPSGQSSWLQNGDVLCFM